MVAQPTLFISYRRTQREHVEPLYQALRQVGVEAFLDCDAIDALADFPSRLREGVDRAHAVLVYWSPDYTDSEICMQELKRAFLHARRRSSDVGRRIWICNPASSVDHILSGELARQSYLMPPARGDEVEWATALLPRLTVLLAEGPLADESNPEPAPTLYTVPTTSNEFSGRAADLWRIHARLHPARMEAAASTTGVQLHGVGGVGKSALAAAYARDFAASYPGGVYWLGFSGWTPSAPLRRRDALEAWRRVLKQTFARHPTLSTTLLQSIVGQDLSPEEVYERLAEHLGNERPYLWVLDDIPSMSPADVRDEALSFLRAPTSSGRTLVTTRDASVADGFLSQRLDTLNEGEAIRLLARHRPDRAAQEQEAMRLLVNEVGAHTLALVLLGQRSREDPSGYPGLLAELRGMGAVENLDAIAEQLRPELGSRARSIAATMALSIMPLTERARALLGVASVCAPNQPIADALLLAASGEKEPQQFAAAMRELLRASLFVRRSESESAVSVHPLVAGATIRLLEVRPNRTRDMLALAMLARFDELTDLTAHPTWRHELPHALHIVRMPIGIFGQRLLRQLAGYHLARGEYALAVEACERSLQCAREDVGDDDPYLLGPMLDLAFMLRKTGALPQAQQLYERTMLQAERLLGPDHTTTLRAIDSYASALTEAGQYLQAIPLKERVVQGFARTLGEANRDTLMSMNNLAHTYERAGRHPEARDLYVRVLKAQSELLGADHEDALATKRNLANVMFSAGRVGEARTVQTQLLADRVRLQGASHPSTLLEMRALADMFFHVGAILQARAPQRRWLLPNVVSLVESRPPLFESLHELQLALRELDDVREAALLQRELTAYQDRLWGRAPTRLPSATPFPLQAALVQGRDLGEHVLREQEKVLGPEHPETLETAARLARGLRLLGELPAALALGERVVTSRGRVLGELHRDTLDARLDLACTLRAHGHSQDPRALDPPVVLASEAFGPADIITVQARTSASQTLFLRGSYELAYREIEQAITVFEQRLGAQNEKTLWAIQFGAHILLADGRSTDALHLEQRAFERHEQRNGQSRDALTSCSVLASSLARCGRRQEARTLFQRVLEGRRTMLGERHPDLAGTLENLAGLARMDGEQREFERLAASALRMKLAMLLEVNPTCHGMLQAIAAALYQRGMHEQASQLDAALASYP
jgi:tetratricopeptide (TPR) repeat protein